MTPKLREAVERFHAPFDKQCDAVVAALIKVTSSFPIASIAIYGSILTAPGPRSDVDILVLLRDDYKERGYNYLDLKLDLEDITEVAKVNEIPVDLHVAVAHDFFDTSRDTDFKRSFSDNNVVMWEDGETLGSRLSKFS